MGKLNTKLMVRILAIVAIVAIVLAGYLYSEVRTLKKNPQATAQEEANDLVWKVSKLVVLPEGETPTVATVADPEALKDQAFFAKAEKGDKVLIYAQAKKAILYSVSLNRVVDVAPLNINSQAPVTPPKADETKDKS
jgi:hypothetical protein